MALRAPAGAGGGGSLTLKPYRTPDGGATAMVPGDPGWNIDGGGGVVLGSSDKGAFLLGRTFKVFLPQSAPQGGGPRRRSRRTSDDPARAAAEVLPKVNPSTSNIRVRRVVRTGVLPSFSASGMYVFDYDLDGKPWTSVATDRRGRPGEVLEFHLEPVLQRHRRAGGLRTPAWARAC